MSPDLGSEPIRGLPIFDELLSGWHHAEQAAEHAGDRVSHLLHHPRRAQPHIAQAFAQRSYDDRELTRTTTTEGNPMASIITDVKNAVSEGIDNIKGWAEDLEQKLPGLVEKAEKYENSPIVQALEAAVLPPGVEQEIANLIAKLGSELGASSSDSGTPASPGTGASTTAPASPITGSGTPAPASS